MSLSAPIFVHQLRCEYQHNPLGLGVLKPRLSWQLAGTGRSIRQSAYRVLVADSEALLDKNIGNIWDTQRVESDRSIQIAVESFVGDTEAAGTNHTHNFEGFNTGARWKGGGSGAGHE